MSMIDNARANQMVTSGIRGVLLTAGLMFGLAVLSVYAYRLLTGNSSDSVIDLPLIILGTAIGGAIGIRIASVNWRETLMAALLSAIGLIVFSRFVSSFPGPWIPGGPGQTLDPATTLVFLAVGTGGVFFLPLFDPAVRRMGPTPSLGKMILVALTLTVLAILVDYMVGGGSFFGLLTLVFGSIAAGILVGAGIILVLVSLTAVGAWLGGLALVLEVFILVAWWLLGTPWFP